MSDQSEHVIESGNYDAGKMQGWRIESQSGVMRFHDIEITEEMTCIGTIGADLNLKRNIDSGMDNEQ